ncbi:RICIN domain-containing protein [Streptomyces pharetrae]|uniref:RICIN domain-containing protein n=1 Tax=Streptomyces pharetrae TaxID=291370 RepID=UPI003356A1D5
MERSSSGSAAPSLNWSLISAGSGYCTLCAGHSGTYPGRCPIERADGAAVLQWPCSGTPDQQWQFIHRTDDYGRLVARPRGKRLEVTAGGIYGGAGLVQQACTSDRAYLKWRPRCATSVSHGV